MVLKKVDEAYDMLLVAFPSQYTKMRFTNEHVYESIISEMQKCVW